MNKSAIKNFSVRARNKLIEDITQKAYELGIKKDEIKDIETFEGGFKIKGVDNSRIYKKHEARQREKLVSKVKEKGFEHVIEEVAYTWFNRFIALRFMEVNEYLPTGVRVLSSIEEGKTEPDIIKEALNVDLVIDKDLVYKFIDLNDMEDLYKYLIIKQCNQLGQIMPMVFENISDYTELLLPDNLLAEGSVIRALVDSIDEEDYKEQVEIIGWMYQYYISEKKDEVFTDLKNNIKITKENIPAATQLFTPKWIVKYMVENSLGRLWLESHPDEELKAQWKYYLEEAEQDPEVQKSLNELIDTNLNPENIKVLDPSMGSGHILVYAFDVLYDIYIKANYSEREIPQLILEKNLYGLDIDDRAGQLAAFALMMKARSKSKRIFREKIELNICSIQESNDITKEAVEYLVNPKDTAIEKFMHIDDVTYLVNIFQDAKEYGSILNVKSMDFNAMEKRLEEIRNGETLDLFEYQYREIILEKLPYLIKQAKVMSQKYNVVCTNPPYMGGKSMNVKLSSFVQKRYPDSKSDLFAVFIEKCCEMTLNNGLQSMITQHSWMFLSSYEKLRKKVISKQTINMVHLGAKAFEEISGEVVQTTAFIFRNRDEDAYNAIYIRLVDIDNAKYKECAFLSSEYRYITQNSNFLNIPSIPIAYWASKKIMSIFSKGDSIGNKYDVKSGLSTGDNDIFVKMWYEVNYLKISFDKKTSAKWYIYNKGGGYRKWYGNNSSVVDWENNGFSIKNSKKSVIRNQQYYFRNGITWSGIGTGSISFRYSATGTLFDSNKGPMIFFDNNDLEYILGYTNSKIVDYITKLLNPTLSLQIGDVSAIPIVIDESHKSEVNKLVLDNILISKLDWDSYETSWGFAQHPLLNYSEVEHVIGVNKIEIAFNRWKDYKDKQFNQLKENEEELNRVFIDSYGLTDELTPNIEEKNITISNADKDREIKSFISYAIGCMFGRYSLCDEGLIYAGGQFNINSYSKFIPVKDNVIIIADDDYFEDDIVNRLVEFVKVTFGEITLEENIDYIAETLDKKSNETSRQTIRRYFLKDFYSDHIKDYSRKPIYWLFDSGNENGFKALIYMHRYDVATVARVRTDYLHKLQKKYEAEVKRQDILLESDLLPREKAAAIKKKDSINKQIAKCLVYDQVIAHVASQKIEIDLDDGVAVNYEKFQGVEIPQGEGKRPLIANLLAKI